MGALTRACRRSQHALDTSQLSRGVRVEHHARQLREGLAYARKVPEILAALWMMTLIGTFIYELEVSLPLFARGPLAGGATTYSWRMRAFGSVLGGIDTTRHAETGAGIAILAHSRTSTRLIPRLVRG